LTQFRTIGFSKMNYRIWSKSIKFIVAVLISSTLSIVPSEASVQAASISNKTMGEGIAYAGGTYVWRTFTIFNQFTSLPKNQQTGSNYAGYLQRENAAMAGALKAFTTATTYDKKWTYLVTNTNLVLHVTDAKTYNNAFGVIYNFCVAEKKKVGN